MDEKNIDLRKLGEEVAALLGWRLGSAAEGEGRWEKWARLERDDGSAVTLHLVTYPKTRLAISGIFPRDGQNGGDYGPSGHGTDQRVTIHVGAERPAKAVAGEITRRLLPAYLPQYAKALERKAADEEGRARADALADRLASVLGEKISDPHRNGERCVRLYRGEWYGDVRIGHGGSVKIELSSLPAVIAERICAVLRPEGT